VKEEYCSQVSTWWST